MISYDDYKLKTPSRFDIPEKECLYCGEPTDKMFCSNSCRICEMND